MLIVALTGGIATGKSIVAAILKKRGCYIHQADRIARELMKPGRPAWQAVARHFGSRVLNLDGTINRPRLSRIVFSNRAEREFLNRLIHPLVLVRKKQAVRRLEKAGRHKIFVSEAALTVESGFLPFFDKVIVTDCPEEVQVRRLMERDGLSLRKARKRISSQMSAVEKLKHADYVVDTSGSLEQTARRTESIYRKLLRDYRIKEKKKPGSGG
jgi:dephospho-CoA kinase